MTLKFTTERLPDCKVKLTVEIEPQLLDKPLHQTARRLSRRVRIPGFRPGKAPFDVIQRRFGREALLDEVMDKEAQGWYEQALEEAALEPFGQAQLDIASYDPLVLTFTLPVAPTANLGQYHDLRLDWEPPVVSDDDLEKELARLQQENASLEPRERPAELEDVATLDIKGRINDKVVVDVQERAVTLNPEVNYPVAGFAAEIVGMSPGQDRELTLTYPQDHANAAWAGKEARFKVHMHNLKVWVTPELDDELAKMMGDYETLDEWRASVRENLETQALNQAEQDYANDVLNALVDQADIEFPAVIIERELDDMMTEMDRSLQQRGLGLDNYLVMIQQSREDYRESLRETAERRVKRGLVLAETIRAEGLKVPDEEIDAEIDRMAEPLGDQAEDMRKIFASEEMRESVRDSLLATAALDTLKAIGRGEYVPPETKDEETKATPQASEAPTSTQVAEESSEETPDETTEPDE